MKEKTMKKTIFSTFFLVVTMNLVLGAAIFTFPSGASAEQAGIVPGAIDFGAVNVNSSATKNITITSEVDDDLRIFAIEFLAGDNPNGAYAVNIKDPIGDPMIKGTYVTVEVTFSPLVAGLQKAFLTIVTNDGTNPIQKVSLSGTGVFASVLMDHLLDFFDTAVGEGVLNGLGPGNSAAGRLRAFGNMLDSAEALIETGESALACGQLWSAYLRTDGVAPPPDFVSGLAIDELGDMILDVIDLLDCALSKKSSES